MAGRTVSDAAYGLFARQLRSAGLVPGVPLAVALSGGPDSVALASLLSRWQEEATWQTAWQANGGGSNSVYSGDTSGVGRPCRTAYAFVVDHGFRGEQGAAEASLALGVAARLGLAPRLLHLRWPEGLPPRGAKLREARTGRYDALLAEADEVGVRAVLTGHHAGDQAETLVLRLSRASGIDGLASIREASVAVTPAGRRVALLRPLLRLPKCQLVAMCSEQRLPFALDPTNDDPAYARNFLRTLLSSSCNCGAAATSTSSFSIGGIGAGNQDSPCTARSAPTAAGRGRLASTAAPAAAVAAAPAAAAPGRLPPLGAPGVTSPGQVAALGRLLPWGAPGVTTLGEGAEQQQQQQGVVGDAEEQAMESELWALCHSPSAALQRDLLRVQRACAAAAAQLSERAAELLHGSIVHGDEARRLLTQHHQKRKKKKQKSISGEETHQGEGLPGPGFRAGGGGRNSRTAPSVLSPPPHQGSAAAGADAARCSRPRQGVGGHGQRARRGGGSGGRGAILAGEGLAVRAAGVPRWEEASCAAGPALQQQQVEYSRWKQHNPAASEIQQQQQQQVGSLVQVARDALLVLEEEACGGSDGGGGNSGGSARQAVLLLRAELLTSSRPAEAVRAVLASLQATSGTPYAAQTAVAQRLLERLCTGGGALRGVFTGGGCRISALRGTQGRLLLLHPL